MALTELLFIYGTLLPGLRLAREMAGAERLGAAQVRGHLYDIGTYPGLIAGDGWVSGEIYRLSPDHLHRLDAVEEFVPGDPIASLYWRDRMEVMHGVLAQQCVWVYRYNRSVEGLQHISQGDYRSYLQGQI